MKQSKNRFFHLFFFAFTFLCLSVLAQAQNITVSGKVIDAATSQPIEGATISVKNGKQKTSTNAAGTFSISAAKGNLLVISFVGFETKQVAVGDGSISVALVASATQLDDIVVTAVSFYCQ